MREFTNHKLIEINSKADNHVYDGEFRVCDFEVGNTGVFLNLKVYCGKERKKHRDVKICLTDFIFQIWKKLSSEQKRMLMTQIVQMSKTVSD